MFALLFIFLGGAALIAYSSASSASSGNRRKAPPLPRGIVPPGTPEEIKQAIAEALALEAAYDSPTAPPVLAKKVEMVKNTFQAAKRIRRLKGKNLGRKESPEKASVAIKAHFAALTIPTEDVDVSDPFWNMNILQIAQILEQAAKTTPPPGATYA